MLGPLDHWTWTSDDSAPAVVGVPVSIRRYRIAHHHGWLLAVLAWGLRRWF